MRSLLALASVLHAEPDTVLIALADTLGADSGAAFDRTADGFQRPVPLLGTEQWRVLPDEEGARIECEILAAPVSSALAGVLGRRRMRAMPDRFFAVVTAVADTVEDRGADAS